MSRFPTILAAAGLALVLGAGAAAARCYQDVSGGGQRCETLNQARSFVAVTPNDGADLAKHPTLGVFVAGTGGGAACVLVAIGEDDTTSVTFSNLQPGSWSPMAVKRILSTGGTCTGIVAGY